MESLITRANTKCSALFQYPLHLVTPSLLEGLTKNLLTPTPNHENLCKFQIWSSHLPESPWLNGLMHFDQANKHTSQGTTLLENDFYTKHHGRTLNKCHLPTQKTNFTERCPILRKYSSKSYIHEVLSLSLKFSCHIPPHIFVFG